jgi:hypothetical protein
MPPGPPPPGPGQANPLLDPMFYFDVMGAMMGALIEAANAEDTFY